MLVYLLLSPMMVNSKMANLARVFLMKNEEGITIQPMLPETNDGGGSRGEVYIDHPIDEDIIIGEESR